jgi:RNA polymerase sigma factor (sigma-70 family)
VAELSSHTLRIQSYLDRMRDGDETARGELLQCASERLRKLVRKMLRAYPRVHRWEETDDVLQNAALRLHRSLGEIALATPRDFFRVAALNIRRELRDLARHYFGPLGHGAKHASWGPDDSSAAETEPADRGDLSADPSRLAAWEELHEQIGALPEEEREVFDLLWYQGLNQAEAAGVLGVSKRTIKRRWQAARLRLHEALHGEMPE